MHLRHRKTCRVCGASQLTPVISLGDQFLQGSFFKPSKETPPLRRIACELVRCDPTRVEDGCGLLQMSKSVPPEVLYAAYWYRSGTNQTMRDHLKQIVETAVDLTKLDRATVIDIGCNDGTLLRQYPKQFRKIGVDPSDVAQEASDVASVVQDVFPSAELDHVLRGAKGDIVTSIAMFYDLEDPVAFCRAIKSVLAPDGLWIFEMSYMPKMLAMNSYDTICHEHLEYYSLAVIENVLRRADLKVVRVEENDINGGSLRCYATHGASVAFRNPQWQRAMSAMRRAEFDLELDTDKPYLSFQDRINVHRDKLLGLLKELKRAGKKIHIYGASTKGNTILQWCGIDSRLIDCAADRNPDKHGARTLGTEIPIVSEDESRAGKPDYYLVLPWHFADEFIKREQATLERGTAMIFPLPDVKIVRMVEGRVQMSPIAAGATG
jgi:SAM-dependent methyltransferase